MANTIEIIIKATDQASKIIAQVETKTTASTAAMVKSFDDVGLASSAVDKRLGEYGAAVTDVARIQNQLRQAQLETVDAANKLAQAQKNLAENTDPSRTAELNHALVDAQVNLDKTGKEVQDLSEKLRTGQAATENASSGFSKMQAAIVTVNQAIQLAGQVIGGLKKVYDATVGSTIEYAARVKDLALTLGLSSEETSKLAGLSQKFGVSIDTLSNSLNMMTRRGMAPTLEGLAELSDRVMAIQDPVERAKLLTDIFGRSWTALMPILEKGSSGIRAAAAEAEKLGKVLSQDDVDAVEKLQIETNTFNEAIDGLKNRIGKGLMPDLVNAATNLNHLVDVLQGTGDPLDRLNYLLEVSERAFGKESYQAQVARDAIEKYRHAIENTPSETFAAGLAKIAEKSRQVASSGLVDYILAEEAGMKKAADAAQALADRQAALLTVGIAGALKNEAKSFGVSQEELRKRLKETSDELANLQRQQGAVKKTTIENAMSTNELAAANARLADMQRQLSKETDPIKQAELAAQIGIQRDRINEANTAVSTYVDNSKRIGELKGQYNDINKEIEANAKTHEEATRRILYGYAEQAIARANAVAGITVMTDTEVKALDALAVQFGIKSQDDVNAMNAILGAAEKLPTGGAKAFDDFLNVVTGRLTMAEQNAQAYADKGFKPIEHAFIKTKDTIEKYGGEPVIIKVKVDPKKAKEDAAALVNSKEMAKVKDVVVTPIKADTSAAITSLNWLSKYGIDPLIGQYSVLIQQAQTFNALVAATPPIPGTGSTTGGACFAADTSILMIDGSTKPIQEIVTDDIIQSFDDSGNLVAGCVLTIQQHEVEEYYALAFEHDRVVVTGEHPFYAPKIKRNVKRVYGDFVAARDLRIGDVVEAVINGRRAQTWLLDMMREEGHIAVYNFSVDEHHYIANGLMVHNAKTPGAQRGADFVVPPGYSGDRFPLMVSSGERVQVTPAGQRSSGNLPAINISQTFNGAQSSPEQYKAIMYEVMTDVISNATRQ